ncbi:cytochrome C [Sulfitobacter mediterraneus]|uniref:Cytochrome C n=2 Tax=Sulfitobacter mediterraneus TaxID=83219 RepID=A0A061SJ82_9RHOB|nr:cytochrome c [Sulfitobacter mediterraneus]KAJ01746.1 cytochrome C [Sulfitobacter mediterraneus]
MMKTTNIALALVASITAGVALAHGGATGIVKERMDGMAAMQKAVKAVTPIMRGQAEYDADAVRSFAAAVEIHSGEAMTKLFPEGTGGKPSEAKDEVWSDWEGFEALAMDLETLGEALATAADNGLAAQASGASSGSMMGTGTMMGGQSTMGSMMGQTDVEMMDADMLASMPADMLFTRISQTCSACHTKYRAESN